MIRFIDHENLLSFKRDFDVLEIELAKKTIAIFFELSKPTKILFNTRKSDDDYFFEPGERFDLEVSHSSSAHDQEWKASLENILASLQPNTEISDIEMHAGSWLRIALPAPMPELLVIGVLTDSGKEAGEFKAFPAPLLFGFETIWVDLESFGNGTYFQISTFGKEFFSINCSCELFSPNPPQPQFPYVTTPEIGGVPLIEWWRVNQKFWNAFAQAFEDLGWERR